MKQARKIIILAFKSIIMLKVLCKKCRELFISVTVCVSEHHSVKSRMDLILTKFKVRPKLHIPGWQQGFMLSKSRARLFKALLA